MGVIRKMLKRLFSRKPPPRVRLSGLTVEPFEVGRNQTVLEAALGQGIAWPHDCTVGTCGSCRAKLLRGKVDAITPFGYTLSREELAAGYILACQAVPETDLEIEVELASGPVIRTQARLTGWRDLTHDIREITWEADAAVPYRAGQYMSVSWPGGPAPRSYSFSKSPQDGGRTTLTAFVRKVPGGAFTEPLFDGAFVDTTFTIEGPHGGFWLRDGAGPILLVGGGSGLSPLVSLLEDAANRGVERDAILLFGGRAARDIYCQDEIAELAARWNGRLTFVPVLSEEQSGDFRHGMVTGEIPEAIAELGGSSQLQAYMCGPPGMIDAGVAVLVEHGVPLDSIHYDKFTDASTKAA